MGLFDLFKSSPKETSELVSKPKREILNYYEKFKNETDRIRNENDLWQKDFNKMLEFRDKAIDFERTGKLSEAIEFYLKSVGFGEKSAMLSINNYSHDIERIIILYGKIKESENQVLFLQKVIFNYPDYRDVKKWAVRLSKLSDTKKTVLELKPSDIKKQVAGNPTIGEQFKDFKNTLPEFNFYHDMPDGMQTFEYLRLGRIIPPNKAKDLRSFKDAFEIILSKAKIAENQSDYKTAIEAYEKLIVEEFEEKQQLFDTMFQKLGDKCQELLKLSFTIKSMEEVAEKLNVTYGYVRKKKSLCVGQLTQWIQEAKNFNSLKNN
mgnify:CR=1 FL=1